MIICLYGPDSYRRQEKLKEYAERYKKRYGCGAENFYLDKEGELDRFKDFCKARSLFESSKLGLVFSASGGSSSGGNFSDLSKTDLKELLSLIKDNLESKELTLILNSEKKPTKDFVFLPEKTLPTGRQAVISHSFDNLGENDLKKFLDLEIKKRGIELDGESKKSLLSVLGQNTWEMISELDKLALLDEKKIDKRILNKHINLLPAVDVFGCLNKIRGNRSVGDRMALLEELLSGGADAAMIFNMSAASFYLDKKQKIKMADYDAAVKSGKLEYEEVLLDMVLESRS